MIPSDPMILVSFLNTQLRDNYPSLDALCSALDLNKEDIIAKMKTIQYKYSEKQNKFI